MYYIRLIDYTTMIYYILLYTLLLLYAIFYYIHCLREPLGAPEERSGPHFGHLEAPRRGSEVGVAASVLDMKKDIKG